MEIRAAGLGPEIEPATYVLIKKDKIGWLNKLVMGTDRGDARMNPGFINEFRETVATMTRRIRSGLPATGPPAIDISTGADPMNEIVANELEPRKRTKLDG